MKNLGEQFAVSFCARHGFRAERFSKEELRQGKTPDFRVFKSSDLVLYCEAKHVQYDEWLDKKLDKARPLELVGGTRHDPIFNRLAEHIHKASQQFSAVNPLRAFPNVLVFVNSDKQCGFPDLLGVLTGNFYAEGGEIAPIYRSYSEGRIREEKRTIDLYVWFNEWKGSLQEGSHFFIEGGKRYERLCSLMNSDPSQHRHP